MRVAYAATLRAHRRSRVPGRPDREQSAEATVSSAGGLLRTGGQVTTVVRSPTIVSGAAPAGDPWRAIYAQTSPGTVDVAVRAGATVTTPFGERETQGTALGSGIVLDGGGRIVTAAHVVEGARSIEVSFRDGSRRSAIVVGRDAAADVALLRVDAAGLALQPLPLGSSSDLSVGQPIAVLGDALGFSRSLSTGVVSGLDRRIEVPSGVAVAHAIQTDAAMNPGNSGGPLLDARGRVIGIADQIATGDDEFGRSGSATSTGVGFAIPVDLVKTAVAQIERAARPST